MDPGFLLDETSCKKTVPPQKMKSTFFRHPSYWPPHYPVRCARACLTAYHSASTSSAGFCPRQRISHAFLWKPDTILGEVIGQVLDFLQQKLDADADAGTEIPLTRVTS